MFRLCGIAVAITLMSVTYPSRSVKETLLSRPLRSVDEIEPAYFKEWNTYMTDVAGKIKSLNEDIRMPLQQDTSLLRHRIQALEVIQKKMAVIVSSNDYYKLIHARGDKGETMYDPKKNRIQLTFYFSGDDQVNRPIIVASFLHEVVHACQYEEGRLAYRTDTQWGLLRDVFDEVEAYKAMFAFEPLSVATLVDGYPVKTFKDIDTAWIRKIRSGDIKLYEKYSAIPLDVESDKETVRRNEDPAAWNYLDKRWTNQKNIQSVSSIKHKKALKPPTPTIQ
jgi:hypothetical protein